MYRPRAFVPVRSWYARHKLPALFGNCVLVMLSPLLVAIAGPHVLSAFVLVGTIMIFTSRIRLSNGRLSPASEPARTAAFTIWILVGLGYYLFGVGIMLQFSGREFSELGMIAILLGFGCIGCLPEQLAKLSSRNASETAPRQEKP
ncbi:MAG TPA: hypothetical protein VFL98_02795 [Candidatus Paceibacterota bacterium]|nr:hypothetical protein [Candidatus Paceibacterota bacterium]